MRGSQRPVVAGIRRAVSPVAAHGLLAGATLMLPAVTFYFFVGRPLLGLEMAAVMVVAVAVLRSGIDRSSAPPATVMLDHDRHALACIVVAVLLTTLGGEGRLVAPTADWLVRDAVLHDLVAQPWPFVYRVEGVDWLLRAPLGMYLLPALTGKLAGLHAATMALWLQNTAAIFAALRLLTAAATPRRSLTVLIVFALFSGWDVPAMLLLHGPAALTGDVGWWAHFFQYSATATQAFWVPNHAIPGWLLAGLLLRWDRRQIGIGVLMAGAALSVVWSPLPLIGALPFLAKAGIETVLDRRIVARDVVMPAAIVVALVPMLLYLAADSLAVPHGFQPLTPVFILAYGLFITFELLPFVVAVRVAGPGASCDGFAAGTWALAIVVLLLLPFYTLGPGNDLVMRASIPALAIVAVTTGHAACRVLAARSRRGIVVVGTTLALGALTGAVQVWHIVAAANYGTSRCGLFATWAQDPGQGSRAHYIAHLDRVAPIVRPVDAPGTVPVVPLQSCRDLPI